MDRQTVVVKVGTSSLTDDRGRLEEEKLARQVDGVLGLMETGYQVVLVSSGAIAAGFHELGLSSRPRTLAGKQAAAAVGQGALVQRYRERFAAKGKGCAQVLLTRSDFADRVRYLNALATINYLLGKEVVPIINENDSVAVDEIRWGDNDTLAALVAGLLQAEWLLLVTNTDGLYTDNPHKNRQAQPIRRLTEVDDTLLQQVDGSKSTFGSGGMHSKLTAARLAAKTGVRVYIGTAKDDPSWMRNAVQQEGSGTYIEAAARHVSRKEQWIAVHSASTGRLHVDNGAARALLQEGGSLLPCGVTAVEGTFAEGEIVEVIDSMGVSIGKGRIRYPATLITQVMGWQSTDVLKLNPDAPAEVIHRDDWVSAVGTEIC
ncbi:glutamate 5-kinase [Desmospora activa]|uniref:Glutamate 5-kinase n=1 Tax=Desmospora activa DSM 45169 TaxID=1121389 RepID=A0A2T4Z8A5_9BACL|nr:glutamate 5-kinase [Desmospora activa]PTM58100.1 glutamate 5-kinase [Desmospora activa DSM 45169]